VYEPSHRLSLLSEDFNSEAVEITEQGSYPLDLTVKEVPYLGLKPGRRKPDLDAGELAPR
jgi:hypothetical protein